MGRTLAEKVWDAHVVHSAEGEPDLLYIDLHLVHEVTSPQAFEGLRQAGRPVRRPDLTLATEDHNVPTEFGGRAPLRGSFEGINLLIADPVSRTQVDTLRANCRGVRGPAVPDGRRRAGHRARRRPATGPHPARHDDRLRRLPHLDPRRLRRAGVRHRDQRGRARAGHPDAAAQAVQDDGHHRRGHAPARGHGEGHHPGGDREDRHRRRPGLRAGVPRRGHPGAVDGRPDDDLQHVDRGRRPRRHDRAGRDHLLLHGRAASTPRAARTGTARSSTGRRWSPTTTPSSTPR